MGCQSCGNKSAGCQNHGYCNTGGCNKLNVFDWFSNMDSSALHQYEVVEVRFKHGRKGYFRNDNKLSIVTGEPVVVDVPNGYHIGYVSLQGELVRLQLAKKGIQDDDQIRVIYRKATDRDMRQWKEGIHREPFVLQRTKEIIIEQKMEMKMTDVEFQADGTKATFYYSADDRVDFRNLIKIMANEFRIHIEMRQINLREEAGRIGGIGLCGRELCCSTWLTDFKMVSSNAARYQNLSLNTGKLSGQCGRLKCCLNYELDTYMEALQDIPTVDNPLYTIAGEAKLQKTDIFRKIMWFGFDHEDDWHSVSIQRVKEIQELNRRGEKPANLQENKSPLVNNHREIDVTERKSRRKGKKKRSKKANIKNHSTNPKL